MKFYSVPPHGDPSSIAQQFSRLNINIICCRYWWLKHWESTHMAFPYWRLYWNKNEGAFVSFNGKEYNLNPHYIYIISPWTPFSSRIINIRKSDSEYLLYGDRLRNNDSEEMLISKKMVLHLYIHFNLGMPFDSVSPGIYVVKVSEEMQKRIERIIKFLPEEYERFSFQHNLDVYTLISESLSEIPDNLWKLVSSDMRILTVLNLIEENLEKKLPNPILANYINMAINSFIRLFKTEIKVSPQKFINKKRIERACVLLQHTNESIDSVASQCGFCDRYYFSKNFKSQMNYSPGTFRKKFK
jgi:AraC-like DNA-binding protein